MIDAQKCHFVATLRFTKQTFSAPGAAVDARSIESPGRGELLLDILEIENDGHIAVEYLKKIDDLCILGAAAGRQADIERWAASRMRLGRLACGRLGS